MKILTLNLWGNCGPYEKRWSFFLEEINSIAPDIICLQEIKDEAFIRRIKEICGTNHVLAANESALAILSKFPFLKTEVLKYKFKSPTENEFRRALISEIQLSSKINKVTVVDTHLSWKPEDESVRIGQIKELLEQLAHKGGAKLLSGDFNDTPKSKAILEIKNAGYFDLLEMLQPGEPNITWDNQNPFIQTHTEKFPDRRIDFLFVNQEFLEAHPPEICEVVFNRSNGEGIYPSDHYGVCVEIGS